MTHETLEHVFPDAFDPVAAHLLWVTGWRLAAAAGMGAVIGWERQLEGKEAGVRTHMLVSLGSALFVLSSLLLNDDPNEASKVIQGVAAGIGFLGAGTILKLSESHEVKGLTTAAGIWLAAAVGVAAGAGLLWPAAIGVVLAWFILFFLHTVERLLKLRHRHHHHNHGEPTP
jgi:putative Mg2+ transporter-C (MgtC) family protein